MGYFFFFKVELKMFQPDKIDKMLLIAANNASISFYYLLGGGLNGPDRYLKLVTIQSQHWPQGQDSKAAPIIPENRQLVGRLIHWNLL